MMKNETTYTSLEVKMIKLEMQAMQKIIELKEILTSMSLADRLITTKKSGIGLEAYLDERENYCKKIISDIYENVIESANVVYANIRVDKNIMDAGTLINAVESKDSVKIEKEV